MRVSLLVIALTGTAAANPTTTAEDLFYGQHGAKFDPAKSFPMAKAACDAGDAFGCSLVGFHYQDGSGVEWSAELAVAAYTKACHGGSGVGCYNLAGMYSGGHGVDVDPAKYTALRKQAGAAWRVECDKGAFRWCSNAGFISEEDGHVDAALVDYDRGCKGGHKISCVEALRVRYQHSTLAGAAFTRELDHICTGGEVVACGVLGSYLATGSREIAKDAVRAAAIHKRGCELNDSHSCLVFGLAHINGEGVPQDFAATERYLRLACERRSSTACVMLAQNMQSHGNTADATTFARRACEMNDGDGCELVATLRANAPDAVKWARESCRKARRSGCDILIDHDVDIPGPADKRDMVYREACTAGHKPACKHVH